MKKMITLSALAALSVVSFAQAQTGAAHAVPAQKMEMHGMHDMKQAKGKHMIECPVSGQKVDMVAATKAKRFADYKGNRYFFCCDKCPAAFKKDSAKYAKKAHIPTPKGAGAAG